MKPTQEPSPEAIALIARMTGPAPGAAGCDEPPIDLSLIDALTLGDVWAVAHATKTWDDDGRVQSLAAVTARAVLDQGRSREPAFRGSACRDYLDLLAARVAALPSDAPFLRASAVWREACLSLARCIDLSFGGLGEAARRFLAAADARVAPHTAIILARLVDSAFAEQTLDQLARDLSGSPLLVAELRSASRLDLPSHIYIAKAADFGEAQPTSGGEPVAPRPGQAGYAAFAETALVEAAGRVRKIHDKMLPYASDKAFTLEEAALLGRMARVALDRDEPWLPPVLDELFRKVSLAPGTAKTLPSQSLAIALGHAVEAHPTPEAVATLRGVLRDMRHSGVKKKLQRNVRGAERGLADRPEIALRLPADRPLSKSELTTLTRCLEACLATGLSLRYDDWTARLAAHPQARGLTGTLLWRVSDPDGQSTTILPVTDRGGLTLRDVAGHPVTAGPESVVALWHPVDATTAERDAWRDRLAALRIRQPFKQAFREYYVVPPDERSKTETAMFAGHVVAIMPFLGLARRERWELHHDTLTRSFGKWTASLEVADHIYPGCGGATTMKNLSLMGLRLGDLPTATLSEILRAVDLLASVSGFAIQEEEAEPERDDRLQRLADAPLGQMAEMRKQALTRILRSLDGMESATFDARHLSLGPYAIHLATGRVTRGGEPVTLDPPDRANLPPVPWLPYDEKLLETIALAALQIARRLGEEARRP